MKKLERSDEEIEAGKLAAEYHARAARHAANAERRAELNRIARARRRLARLAIDAERRELTAMLDAGIINDETMRLIETRIDHAEMLAADDDREAQA